jgi:photosystem II stability/assembly factor-like uncharacterized protein
LSTGITQAITRVRIIDSDSLVVAGGCAVRRSDDSGETFTRLPWTASDQRCTGEVMSLHFPSSEIGYLVIQNGTVLRTADGGRTWTRKTALPDTPSTGGTSRPTDIWFTGPDTGLATTTLGAYRTVDGGNSWTPVLTHAPATPSRELNGLFFLDAATGWIVGNKGVLVVTTDGGVTWDGWLTNAVESDLTSIRCANALTCLVTTRSGDRLLRTTTGGSGLSSHFSNVSPSTEKIHAAAFASPSRAVAAGAFGTNVVSDDAGLTWSTVGGRLTDDFNRLRATSASLAFATGDNGSLARTTDAGVSWTSFGVSTSANVIDASFPDVNTGYALDSEGSVLRTDNGGTSWKILDTGTTARPSALLAIARDRVLLFGPRGVRRSADGGGEFALVGGRIRKSRLDDFDRAGNSAFAFGFDALYASTDSGKRWKAVPRPARRAPRSGLAAVDFVTSRSGFALTLDGRLWQTRNRGRRWRELPNIGSDSAFELSFSDSRNGFAAVRELGGHFGSYVLRTRDGGKTWQPQLVHDNGIDGNGLVASGSNSALLLTLDNGLFATSSGGEAGKPSTLTLSTKKRKLRKRATLKVTGKLSPAEGGEQVVVSMRGARLVRWRQQVVTVASDGSFTTSWKVRTRSHFVAQWSGDDDRSGDGSKLLTVKVR